MSGVSDIVIAGAGAVGSAIAYRLARAGHAVTVVDPGPPGANASGVAAGMLAPAFESLFDAPSHGHFALLAAARDLWPALAEEIGLPLAREGALAAGSQAETAQWAARLEAMGARARQLSPAEAGKLAPVLPPGDWAVHSPEDWRLEAPEALQALRAGAERAGARFVAGRVTGFAGSAAQVAGVPDIPARKLVLAAGAARLTALAPELTVLAPIKGHILRARGDVGAGPTLRASGVYLCRNGREAVLGATMEAGAADPSVDPAVARRLLAEAGPLIAGLGPLDWRAAAGVRASTPDGLPLAGESRAAGVILAAGMRRNGWLLAPLVAQVVLDLVEDRARSPAAALFDPARAFRADRSAVLSSD